MAGINYLDGSIYHMVHFDTSKEIFQRRAILSKIKVLEEDINYRSIAFEDVQSLRDRVYVRDIFGCHPESCVTMGCEVGP